LHRGRDFGSVRLQREMPGIEELNPRVRDVLSKSLGAPGMKKGSFLPHIASSGGCAFRK